MKNYGTIHNYEEALAILGDKASLKIGYHTYLERVNPDFINVRFYTTPIIKYYSDGSLTLGTDGWRTYTTKDRINRFAPVNVGSNQGEWKIWTANFNGDKNIYFFEDGILIRPSGCNAEKYVKYKKRHVKHRPSKYVELPKILEYR